MKPIKVPEKRLLLGFPYVDAIFSYSDYILECSRLGVDTRLFINFGEGGVLYNTNHDKDTEQNSLRLEDFRKRNIPIYWDPTLIEETIVMDELFHRGGDTVRIPENFIPFRRLGFFNVIQGTVILLQKLRSSNPDLDVMVRLFTG